MTAPSNTPDKPMTREEAVGKAWDDFIAGADGKDWLHSAQFEWLGLSIGFSAGESFARQSILKEMEGWDWITVANEIEDIVDYNKGESYQKLIDGLRGYLSRKLKGGGV